MHDTSAGVRTGTIALTACQNTPSAANSGTTPAAAFASVTWATPINPANLAPTPLAISPVGATTVSQPATDPYNIYQFQRSTTLKADSWIDIGVPYQGIGGTLNLVDPDPLIGPVFYRILIDTP